jgi:hypothetical protein
MRRVIHFQFLHGRANHSATIALMARFKAAGKKKSGPAGPAGGLPCVILLIIGLICLGIFMYLAMRGSTTS